MLLGLSLANFTILHVAITVIAIAAGLVFFGVLSSSGRWLGFVHGLFIDMTILTSITGFMFPPKPIGPPFIFGVVSLVLLFIALAAQFGGRLQGRWRPVHLATALIAQWLNMVVLVVQSFQKIPVLNAVAPTGTEPPFLTAQALVFILILLAAWRTVFLRPARLGIAG